MGRLKKISYEPGDFIQQRTMKEGVLNFPVLYANAKLPKGCELAYDWGIEDGNHKLSDRHWCYSWRKVKWGLGAGTWSFLNGFGFIAVWGKWMAEEDDRDILWDQCLYGGPDDSDEWLL